MHKFIRILGALIAATLVMGTLMLSAPPEAAAHAGDYEHDDRVEGHQCPSDTHRPNGAAVENLFDRFGPFVGCTPLGYVPIFGNTIECAKANGTMSQGVCTFDRARECGEDPAFTFRALDGQCLRLALMRAPVNTFVDGLNPPPYAIPVCVNSSLVHEAAPGGSVGQQFSSGGQLYEIMTGSGCGFGCIDGWDANCDGKIGDFCASELDLAKVSDVATCLDALKPASTQIN